MKSMFRNATLILSLIAISGLFAATFAQKPTKTKAVKKATKVEFLAKGDGVESCPVTGEKLESKTIKAEFFGREVYFCCNDCLATAQKNPAAYVKKTEDAQIAAVKAMTAKAGKSHGDNHGDHHGDHHGNAAKAEAGKFLGKGDGIETCPVTGEAISKDVKVEVDGRTVYACCPGCLDKIKKNPELYLKSDKK